MNKSHWLRRLEILFQILAWATLTFVCLSLVNSMRSLLTPLSPFERAMTDHETFLIQLKFLMAGLGDTFFAFLLSFAMSMIRQQKPIDSKKIDLFLKLTCFGFFVEGVLGAVGWFKLVESQIAYDRSTSFLLTSIPSLAPSLLSCLYAVTLYILFHHFFKLITFKSEVV